MWSMFGHGSKGIIMIYETIENDNPNCEHEWYQLAYAISTPVYRCSKCHAERWIHFLKE